MILICISVILIIIYIIYIKKRFNNDFHYIEFINKFCKDENLENSLYYYINGNRNNEIINAILYRNKVIDKSNKFTDVFENYFQKYNDLLKSRLEYKQVLKKSYNNLFLTNESFADLYKYWDYNDNNNVKWISYMSTLTKYDAPNIVNNIKNHLISPILDIGGNNGTLANCLKNYNSSLDIVVFDLPQVVEIGKEKFKNINFVSGNFLESESIPHGFYTCIFKSVLHDHDDISVINLLNSIKTKFKRGIICEVMGNLKELKFEKPYFDYLIPFSNVIRKKEWYVNLIKKLNMKIIEVNECKETCYTTIFFDFY